MTSRDFCYWLQGFFEIHGSGPRPPEPHDIDSLKSYQVDLIKKHLALVFEHEIDPTFGDKKKQDELNKIHNKPPRMDEGIARC